MPGPFGDLTPARRVRSAAIKGADVVCTLYGIDGSDDESGVYWRQTLGVRSLPTDGAAEAIATLDGPYREIVLAYHPKAKLDATQPKGSTWLYSHGGGATHVIDLRDGRLNLGLGAEHPLLYADSYLDATEVINKFVNGTFGVGSLMPPAAVDLATTLTLLNYLRVSLASLGTLYANLQAAADAGEFSSKKNFTV